MTHLVCNTVCSQGLRCLRDPHCSQADELRALAGLARDAAEILFEMAALQDESEAAQDMLEKSQQLQVLSCLGQPGQGSYVSGMPAD